jgi:hypothetical protein
VRVIGVAGGGQGRDPRARRSRREGREAAGEQGDRTDDHGEALASLATTDAGADGGAGHARAGRRLEPVTGVGHDPAQPGIEVVVHHVLPPRSWPRPRARVARALANCDFTVPTEHPSAFATSDSGRSA